VLDRLEVLFERLSGVTKEVDTAMEEIANDIERARFGATVDSLSEETTPIIARVEEIIAEIQMSGYGGSGCNETVISGGVLLPVFPSPVLGRRRRRSRGVPEVCAALPILVNAGIGTRSGSERTLEVVAAYSIERNRQ